MFMNRIISREGITLNGRRYNCPDLQEYVGVDCTVIPIDANSVCLHLKNGHEFTVSAQTITLTDVEPCLNDRVQIIGGIAKGKSGYIWEIDECEYLIVADDDDDYPHGYQRDEFMVLSS